MIKENIIQEIDQHFKVWDKPDSPGCALAIIKNGNFFYKKSYGMADLEHNIPITSQSIFCTASITKQVIAMCILLLNEKNKLTLSDEIRDYLPHFPNYNQFISIQNLIYHTSGIRDFTELILYSDKHWLADITKQEALQMILKQKQLSFNPGDDMLYSNSNYLLLAKIIENITGKSVREFADQNVFKPLNMTNSHLIYNNMVMIKNRAFGYIPDGLGNYFNPFRNLIGVSLVYTSVEDIFLWDQNYYNNKLGNSGQNLIKTMLKPFTLNDGTVGTYAFGIGVDNYKGEKRNWMNGRVKGYRSQYLSFPEHQLSVIILANAFNLRTEEIADNVADIILKKTQALDIPKILIGSKDFIKYMGKYYSETLGMIEISKVKDDLTFQSLNFGIRKIKLISESETSFFLKGFNVKISFKDHMNQLHIQYLTKGMGRDGIFDKLESTVFPKVKLMEYVGKYYCEEINTTYELIIKDEGLSRKKLSWLRINLKLEFLKKDKFQIFFNAYIKFKRANNTIEGFELDSRRLRNIWFKKIN